MKRQKYNDTTFELLANENFEFTNDSDENNCENSACKEKTNNEILDAEDIFLLFMHDINKYPVLTPKETIKLLEEYKNGNAAAKETIVNGHLRLVVHVACRFYDHNNPDIMDFIQEGTLALLSAIDHYDINKGALFSTYASECIYFALCTYITRKRRVIKLPFNMSYNMYRYKKLLSDYAAIGNDPSDEDIISTLGISKKQLDAIKRYEQDVVSLNTEIPHSSNGGPLTVENAIAGNDYEDMVSYVEESEKTDYVINNMLSKLSPIECEIVVKKFGLANTPPATLESIATQRGISRERVNQILHKALKKLKNKCPEARDFMD